MLAGYHTQVFDVSTATRSKYTCHDARCMLTEDSALEVSSGRGMVEL